MLLNCKRLTLWASQIKYFHTKLEVPRPIVLEMRWLHSSFLSIDTISGTKQVHKWRHAQNFWNSPSSKWLKLAKKAQQWGHHFFDSRPGPFLARNMENKDLNIFALCGTTNPKYLPVDFWFMFNIVQSKSTCSASTNINNNRTSSTGFRPLTEWHLQSSTEDEFSKRVRKS